MNYGAVNYHWNHSNLKEGIKTGYKGTLKAIEEYETKKKQEGQRGAVRKSVIDLLERPEAMRAARWRFGDMQKWITNIYFRANFYHDSQTHMVIDFPNLFAPGCSNVGVTPSRWEGN